jgi:gliding motility-associated-like protein
MKRNLLKISFLIQFFVAFSSKAFNVDTLFICKNSCINYSNVTTAGTAVAWTWTFQGASTSGSNLQNPPNVCYPTAGVFLTTVKTTFDDGKDTTDEVRVAVYDWPMPAFSFPKDTGYCAGANFPLTLNTLSHFGATYKWSTGATSQSITVNTQGTYWVNVLLKASGTTCDSVYKEVDITEYPLPTVNLGQDKTMCQNQTIRLDAGPGAGYTYSWLPNGEATRTLDVNIPGIYRARVTTDKGCFAEDEIELVDSCPHYVYVPNAVSPNEDRLNDLFVKVWNFTPKDYVFRIFNRWGELLYESTDLTAGWDCKVKGELVCQDIYVYKITYVDNDKRWYEMRGTFFVVR